MKSNLTPRYIIISIVLVWAVYAIWPSVHYQMLSEDQKESMRQEGTLDNLENKIIRQGLDLKGGMYIVLEVDLPALMNTLAINKDANFEQALETASQQMETDETDFFTRFQQVADDMNLRLARYFLDYGTSDSDIISELSNQADDAINRVLEILQNRIDQFGVSEPTIQKQGKHRIIVELAGIQDTERARALLQSTALLEFFIVKKAEVTNDLLVRIDDVLKGREDVADLTGLEGDTARQAMDTTGAEEAPVSEDKTMSVSELFGESEPATTAGADSDSSVVVDQRLFEDRPFSSLLRNLQSDIGIPESNVYAVKKYWKCRRFRTSWRRPTVNSCFPTIRSG